MVSISITHGLECRPLARFLDSNVPGTCIDYDTFFIAATSIDIALSLAILVLPLPFLWKLQMPTSKKLSVMGIFVLGGL